MGPMRIKQEPREPLELLQPLGQPQLLGPPVALVLLQLQVLYIRISLDIMRIFKATTATIASTGSIDHFYISHSFLGTTGSTVTTGVTTTTGNKSTTTTSSTISTMGTTEITETSDSMETYSSGLKMRFVLHANIYYFSLQRKNPLHQKASFSFIYVRSCLPDIVEIEKVTPITTLRIRIDSHVETFDQEEFVIALSQILGIPRTHIEINSPIRRIVEITLNLYGTQGKYLFPLLLCSIHLIQN
jgi:hypothetical protein